MVELLESVLFVLRPCCLLNVVAESSMHSVPDDLFLLRVHGQIKHTEDAWKRNEGWAQISTVGSKWMAEIRSRGLSGAIRNGGTRVVGLRAADPTGEEDVRWLISKRPYKRGR